MIKLVEVYKDGCQKCESVKRILTKISEEHNDITVRFIEASNFSPTFFWKFGIQYVPAVIVYVGGSIIDVIKSGFAPKSLRFQIEELTGKKLRW